MGADAKHSGGRIRRQRHSTIRPPSAPKLRPAVILERRRPSSLNTVVRVQRLGKASARSLTRRRQDMVHSKETLEVRRPSPPQLMARRPWATQGLLALAATAAANSRRLTRPGSPVRPLRTSTMPASVATLADAALDSLFFRCWTLALSLCSLSLSSRKLDEAPLRGPAARTEPAHLIQIDRGHTSFALP